MVLRPTWEVDKPYFGRMGLTADGGAHRAAPVAHLHVVHAVDGFVGPDGFAGGKGLRIGVAGCGVYGQQSIAFAVAAIDLDFATVQIRHVAAPAPGHIHMIAGYGGVNGGLHGGQVGTGLDAANDAEVGGDGVGAFAAVLDELDEGEDAGERAGGHGHDAGGQGGRGEHGQGLRGGAGAGLGFLGGVGAGLRPSAQRGQPGLQDINNPAAIGPGGGGLCGGQAQKGGIPGKFVAEVSHPEDLIASADGIVGVSFHFFVFCFVSVDGHGRHVAGITGFEQIGGGRPPKIGVVPFETGVETGDFHF